MFGSMYAIGPGHFFYCKVYPIFAKALARRKFAPNAISLATASFDVLLPCTLIYYPMFYIAQEIVYKTPSRFFANPVDLSAAALRRYQANFVGDTTAMIGVWIPLHFVNFRFIPLHFRMPFLSLSGLLWVAILSSRRGSDKAEENDQLIDCVIVQGSGAQPNGVLEARCDGTSARAQQVASYELTTTVQLTPEDMATIDAGRSPREGLVSDETCTRRCS
jgi:hypothetical protein